MFRYFKFCTNVDYLQTYLSTYRYFTSQVVSIYAAYSRGPEFKSQTSGWLHWGYSCVSLVLQGKCQISTSNKVTCFEKLKQLHILKETGLLLMGVHWAVVNK